jgi:hypothetical protein
MLSCVRVQVHFKKNVSLKLKNRIRISGFSSTGVFIEKHRVFCKPGKIQNKIIREKSKIYKNSQNAIKSKNHNITIRKVLGEKRSPIWSPLPSQSVTTHWNMADNSALKDRNLIS